MCVDRLGLHLYSKSTGPLNNFWPKSEEAVASSASMVVMPLQGHNYSLPTKSLYYAAVSTCRSERGGGAHALTHIIFMQCTCVDAWVPPQFCFLHL